MTALVERNLFSPFWPCLSYETLSSDSGDPIDSNQCVDTASHASYYLV